MSDPFSLSNIVAGLLVSVIYSAMVAAARFLQQKLDRLHPSVRKAGFTILLCAAVIGNVVLYYTAGGFFPIFSTVLLLIAFYAGWWQLQQFWEIGLIGADREISGGINYYRSLNMCKNSLSFLGVGARKLTSEPNFEDTIRRYNRPTRPIRFLLSKPDNKLLRKAAQNASEAPDEYENRVRESLRVIANLKNRRQWNIEVRFYEGSLPLFRLMFIDDWLCLASHYVFGEGDGADWPQLHIRRSATDRDVKSLYHPFQQYFDQLWQTGEVWDFAEFIQEA
jgi:hypothetical protein